MTHEVTIERRVLSGESNLPAALHPVLRRVYANRGIEDESALDTALSHLLPYTGLLHCTAAAKRLAHAVLHHERILIIGDYDADGATSTAVAVRALRAFGASQVDFLVPNRFTYGYGLTPDIVRLAETRSPQVIITVDNGIASVEGVALANTLNIDVVITDHHLAGEVLPAAHAIVNPNQPHDTFASKCIAGVGVIFYVMLATRQVLKELGAFDNNPAPHMASLLDIVALGTVADVVPLDKNNRILVEQGLRRIRAKQCVPGILALLQIGKRAVDEVVASDLGFTVGPRLNAAGRLDDMSIGIRCLLSDDAGDAMALAMQLESLNEARKVIEAEMAEKARETVSRLQLRAARMPPALCLLDDSWHQGVIGLVASRIKEQWHRPVIAFAKISNEELKGSARSITGFHIRDALAAIANTHPQVLKKFGGHAMAAGLSLHPKDYEEFKSLFEQVALDTLSSDALRHVIHTDGELLSNEMTLSLAETLRFAGPWGQQFPEPLFDGVFTLLDQRLVGNAHLKCALSLPGSDRVIEAIAFNVDLACWPNTRCRAVKVAYRLGVNRYLGKSTVQFIIAHITAYEGEII